MRNSKLCYYLLRLNSKQRKSFHDFLASPYFNKKPEPAKLFRALDEQILSYKLRNISLEEAFAEVYPKKPFRQSEFRKLMNRLLDLFFEFLAHEDMCLDKEMRMLVTHKAVSRMGADRYFEFLHKKTAEALDPNGRRYFERAYYIEMHSAELVARKSARALVPNLGKMIFLLEQGYAIQKLHVAFNVLNQARIHGGDPSIPGVDTLLKELEQDINERPILVQLTYHRYLMIAGRENTGHYHRLRALMEIHAEEIDHDIAGDMYAGIQNFCVYRINAGASEFVPEMLKVYQAMLKEGHILQDGHILPGHFKNIVVVAARSGAFAWANWFIAHYGASIGPNEEGNALTYNRAVLHYFEGRIREAQKGFVAVTGDVKDIYYGVDARVYLLRIYYETSNVEKMELLCHSFRIYINRSKNLPETRKNNYMTFISLYRRLVNIPPRDGERLLKLRSDIVASARIAPKDWLLENIDVLIKNLPQRYRNGRLGQNH